MIFFTTELVAMSLENDVKPKVTIDKFLRNFLLLKVTLKGKN